MKDKVQNGNQEVAGATNADELGKRKVPTTSASQMMAENSMLDSPQKRVKVGEDYLNQ